MPTVRRIPSSNGGVPSGEVTPEEAAKIRAVAEGKETAPSSREQSSQVDWKKVQDQLGQPFNVKRIPLSKLELMRRDAILGFGLSFIKVPLARANWYANAKSIDGPNAQIAAHLDHDLRRIWASTVFNWANSLDFGFQAIVKRYELGRPAGTYIDIDPDTGEATEKPIWDEGNIDPIRWKPFVSLPPATVEPKWNGKGEFDGILYTPPSTGGGAHAAAKTYKVEQSLWVTNEKESVFGSMYGYSRLGYAYPYWWSYWFRWAIADRAFEKRADPSTVVRHPEGFYEDPDTGERIPYRDIALSIGEQMRSGASLAIPSTVYAGEIDGKPSSTPEWNVDFLKGGVDLEQFDRSFDYIDVMKLRALWIPEQAFFEGKGGTSSRNVASEQFNNFTESQELLKSSVVDMYNRWVIPQWLAINYPEFVANGGTAEVIVKGFADKDVELQRQIIQLIGQQEAGQREMLTMVNMRQLLEEAGTPLVSFAEQKARESQVAQQQQAAAPPVTEPVPGEQVGVQPTATGFSYVQPREIIYLSESSTDFLERLPDSPHYKDRTIKRHARALWETWRSTYREDYEDFAKFIEDGEVSFAAEEDDFDKKAASIVKKWRRTRDVTEVLDRSSDLIRRVLDRSAAITRKQYKLDGDAAEKDLDGYAKDRSTTTLSKVFNTTNDELAAFIAKELRDGVEDHKTLAERVRDHFTKFSDWKADRLVRTEIRDAYNAATLYATTGAGLSVVQAVDAVDGDTDQDCLDRNGKIFSVEDAFAEDEHPNGTLHWRPVKGDLKIERVATSDGPIARFDSETTTVFFNDLVSKEQERVYMFAMVEQINGD